MFLLKENKVVEQERHAIPKSEEVLPDLHNWKTLSELDLKECYYQKLSKPDQVSHNQGQKCQKYQWRQYYLGHLRRVTWQIVR